MTRVIGGHAGAPENFSDAAKDSPPGQARRRRFPVFQGLSRVRRLLIIQGIVTTSAIFTRDLRFPSALTRLAAARLLLPDWLASLEETS